MTDSAISGAATGLAGRYATALFELAAEAKALDETATALASVKAALAQSSDFRQLVASHQFGRDSVVQAVNAVSSELGLPKLTGDFLSVLAGNGRLSELSNVIRLFDQMLAVHRGVTTAEVISAQPLNGDQIAALETKLKARTGHAITANVTVDPEILGGLVVRIGSEQIDSSVRTRLERLGQQMKG